VLDCSRDRRRAGGRLDACADRRGKTHPVNPLRAKRIPAQIRSLCRAYTDEAVRSLAAIMRQADAPPKARIQAIAILLDRGWGKAPQPHTEDDPFPLASRECVMTRYRPRQFTLARPLGVAHLAHLTENHPSERRCVR